jgi:YfiR/HmsC-like
MSVFLKCRAWFIAVLAVHLLGGGVAVAQSGGFSEYDVKAAFLYNFGKFIEWPTNAFSSTNAPLVIGVYGESPFGRNLADVVRGRRIQGHPVIARSVSLDDLGDCQILFICQSERNNIKDVLKALDHSAVLTVTENMDLSQSGVIINFIIQDERVRFEIDNTAAEKVGLKISSKLLILATKTTMIHKNDKPAGFLCARYP